VSHPLRALGRSALSGLADAFATGSLGAPVTRGALAPHVPAEHLDAVWAALAAMEADGMAPRHLGQVVRLLVEERDAGQRTSDRVQLVWSPPDLDAIDARDTAVVVQELFRRAKASVLISTFALDEKKKAQALFGELAERMDQEPSLVVRVFANIHRRHLDETPSIALVREFARKVREDVWPGTRLPEVFYDPRSLEVDGHTRAVLHAKAVVVDARWTLLTSANFTEAAHERNIEAGVVIDDRRLAERVARQFHEFVERRVLQRLVVS
jgi:phosphatidylserine/phosphatidylglycerophosphate/cardiolipin synthase-like enzyme